jgi:large subunit ribosomal protein L24
MGIAPKPKLKTVPKLKVKTGDTVLIISGKDKGERGEIIRVDPERQRVWLEGLKKDKDGNATPLNAITRHRKPRTAQEQGERVRVPGPLHVSNVMVIDPNTDKATRVGRKVIAGKKGEPAKIARYAKVSDKAID